MTRDRWPDKSFSQFTQPFVCKFDKMSVFWTVAVGYAKSYQSAKSLKVVNNWLWRSLISQNFQMICRSYFLDKQHANISPLILKTWLIAMHCSQKKFHFLSAFNFPRFILSDISIFLAHETIFVGYFWKVTDTCKRYV